MKVFAKIEIPFNLAMPGGDLHDFVYEWILKGYERQYDNGTLTLQGTSPDFQPSFVELAAIVTNGGKFEGIKLGVELGWAQRNNQVPAGIRGRDYTDENDDPQVRTWIEWAAAGNLDHKKKTDNSLAIFKAAWDGSTLNSAELEIIHALAYANVIEFQDLVDRGRSGDYE